MSLNIRIFLILILVSALSACGGGGGSTISSNSSSGSNSGSSGSGSASAGNISTTDATISGNNVAQVIIDHGPTGMNTVNEVFTSVTICDASTPENCQTIDHILVDTGSYGLRIISSALSSSLNLTSVTDNNSGNPVGACGMFVDGYTWGPVKLATIKIADETAPQIPIQVIGESGFTPVPTTCSSTGTSENTVAKFGANGVLGVGYFQQDCGANCAKYASLGVYYSCTTSTCTEITLPTSQQITNPVPQFTSTGDDNGVMLILPSLPASGASNVTGSLVFGIGTQTNNSLGTAQVYTVNSSGYLTTEFNGQPLSKSFIDSGSNGLYFTNAGLPALTTCYTSFYCPSSTQNLTAVIQGQNSNQTTVDFSVANAGILFNTGYSAFDNLAGTGVGGFDWGLPFFYGRKVFFAIDGQLIDASTGPFVAF